MPVAVVTGSNKGIGLGIVRALCKEYQGDVYLTSRDEVRGLVSFLNLHSRISGSCGKFEERRIDTKVPCS